MMGDYDKQKHEEAYARGVQDAKNAGLLDEILHDWGDAVTVVFPSTSEHESYEAGYHAQMSGKNSQRQPI